MFRILFTLPHITSVKLHQITNIHFYIILSMLINLCPDVLTIKQKLRKLIWLKHGWHGGGWWDGEVIFLLSSFLRCPQSCWWLFRHFRWFSQSPYFSSGYKSLKLNCYSTLSRVHFLSLCQQQQQKTKNLLLSLSFFLHDLVDMSRPLRNWLNTAF